MIRPVTGEVVHDVALDDAQTVLKSPDSAHTARFDCGRVRSRRCSCAMETPPGVGVA